MNATSFWDKFIFEFCKVEFLCWHGEPNWLGWIVIAIGGIIAAFIILAMLGMIMDG